MVTVRTLAGDLLALMHGETTLGPPRLGCVGGSEAADSVVNAGWAVRSIMGRTSTSDVSGSTARWSPSSTSTDQPRVRLGLRFETEAAILGVSCWMRTIPCVPGISSLEAKDKPPFTCQRGDNKQRHRTHKTGRRLSYRAVTRLEGWKQFGRVVSGISIYGCRR